MANELDSSDYREYASVDTDPAADYFTNEVSLRQKQVEKMFFSFRDQGASSGDFVVILTLQFKCTNDADWTDYDTYTIDDTPRQLIEGNAGNVLWRLGIKNTEYTSGAVTFGFDW